VVPRLWGVSRIQRSQVSLERICGAWFMCWDTRLGLYPFPVNLVFERGLHSLQLWKPVEHKANPVAHSNCTTTDPCRDGVNVANAQYRR
jgi:hypothetical protein